LSEDQITRKLNVENVELHTFNKKTHNIYEEMKYIYIVFKNPYKKSLLIKIKFLLKSPQSW